MRHKEHLLTQNIKHYTLEKDACKKNANLSKYASIFAGTCSGIATIVAITSYIKAGHTNDAFFAMIAVALALAIQSNNFNDTHTALIKDAKKHQKKIQKHTKALAKITKYR